MTGTLLRLLQEHPLLLRLSAAEVRGRCGWLRALMSRSAYYQATLRKLPPGLVGVLLLHLPAVWPRLAFLAETKQEGGIPIMDALQCRASEFGRRFAGFAAWRAGQPAAAPWRKPPRPAGAGAAGATAGQQRQQQQAAQPQPRQPARQAGAAAAATTSGGLPDAGADAAQEPCSSSAAAGSATAPGGSSSSSSGAGNSGSGANKDAWLEPTPGSIVVGTQCVRKPRRPRRLVMQQLKVTAPPAAAAPNPLLPNACLLPPQLLPAAAPAAAQAQRQADSAGASSSGTASSASSSGSSSSAVTGGGVGTPGKREAFRKHHRKPHRSHGPGKADGGAASAGGIDVASAKLAAKPTLAASAAHRPA